MGDRKLIDEANEKRRHCERLLESYDLVLEDLSDWDTEERKFVRGRVEWMRADIVEEIETMTRNVSTIRSGCAHALELVGEGRPPFLHCVKCGHTEAE